MNCKKLFLLCSLFMLMGTTAVQAQEMKVKGMTHQEMSVDARSNARKDASYVDCALVKVRVVAKGVKFYGPISGDVAEHIPNEYWVYLSPGTYQLHVSHPDYLPLDINFRDYNIRGVKPRHTYMLTIQTAPTVAETMDQPVEKNTTPKTTATTTPSTKTSVVTTTSGTQSSTVSAVARDVTIHVTDTDGEGIIGATVAVLDQNGKRTSIASVTDFVGKCTMKLKQGQKVQVSYIGYDVANRVIGENNTYEVKLYEQKNYTYYSSNHLRFGHWWTANAVAGANFASASPKDWEGSMSSKTYFHAGVSIGNSLGYGLGLQTGLFYSMKGFKQSLDEVDTNCQLSYIELPLQLTYATPLRIARRSLGIAAGGYVAYGLGGSMKTDGIGESQDPFKDADLNRLDYGLQFNASIYLFSRISLNAGYQLGLGELKNRNVMVGLRYRFGGFSM